RLSRDFSPFGTVSTDSVFRVQWVQFFFIGIAILLMFGSFFSFPFKFNFERARLSFIPPWFLCSFALLLCFFGPPLALLYFQKFMVPFKFFAGDTFYYLTIAQNFAQTSSYTFDLMLPTNGFHPLWGYFLGVLYRATNTSQEIQIYLAFLSSLIFTGLAVFILGALLYHQTRSFFWSFLTLFPGYSYLLTVALNKNHGTLWSFANGMESSFSLFFGSLVFWGLYWNWPATNHRKKLIFLGVLLSLCTLSRLDDIFLYGAVLLLSFSASKNQRLSRVIFLAIPGFVMIGAYLLYNYVSTGMMLPISGKFKQGLGFLPNLYFLVETFFPFLTRPLDLFEYSPSFWPSTSWRIVQMLFPVLIAVFILSRKSQASSSLFVPILCSYILFKGAYHFFCVGLWHQGQWYYPLSMVASHILITLTLASWLNDSFFKAQKRYVLAVFFLWSLLLTHVFWIEMWSATINQHYYDFFQRRESLKSLLTQRNNAPNPLKLLSYEDGIIAYSLKFPTLNGLGFALNSEAAPWKLNGNLLSYAYEKGYRILCSLVYAPSLDPSKSSYSSEEIRASLEKAFYMKTERDFQKWRFELYYRDRLTGALFIRFFPKD
ncbi:MAG: hypothetical protein AABZ60_19340, partial [Planctomycetota bacterium]